MSKKTFLIGSWDVATLFWKLREHHSLDKIQSKSHLLMLMKNPRYTWFTNREIYLNFKLY